MIRWVGNSGHGYLMNRPFESVACRLVDPAGIRVGGRLCRAALQLIPCPCVLPCRRLPDEDLGVREVRIR